MKFENDTIAAISTPFNVGGIGIVRISGDKAKEIATDLVEEKYKDKVKKLDGYNACYVNVYDDEGFIDNAIVLYFKNPKSYTGEDVIEISTHGGIYVVKRMLRAVISKGARIAEAGEFTKRAFLNGKIDLSKAEGIADIINATSKSAHTVAASLTKGHLGKEVSFSANKLSEIISHLEALIDFPEEDLIGYSDGEIIEKLDEIKEKLGKLKNSYDYGRVMRNGADIVIAGAPNVGKSTLMNLLLGYDRSIVTDIEGTTRDLIEENADLDGLSVRLTDTAGIRNTTDIVEEIGVKYAIEKAKNADLLLYLVDASSPKIDDSVAGLDIPKILIINKIDLADADIKGNYDEVIKISAKTGFNKEELVKKIKELLHIKNIDINAPVIVNERQLDGVIKALNFIEEAINDLNMGVTHDAVAVTLENALDWLLEIKGDKPSDMIINDIFSKFCVGK